jgi:hypothetical protein
MLSVIRDLSLDNQEYLRKLTRHVLQSSELIKEIDLSLNKDLPNLRKDMRKWIRTVEKSKLLPIEKRESFLRGLGEV